MCHVGSPGHRQPVTVVNFNKAVNQAYVGDHLLSISLEALKPSRALKAIVLAFHLPSEVFRAAVFCPHLMQFLLMVLILKILLHRLKQ